jgi:AP-2 complex subunit alpha
LDINSFITSQPRGLYNFISEIRNAKGKDDERQRVDRELANVRMKFANSANLSSRDKKKYIWKLCYIYMLGYDIDFGHLEFISLLSSTKFQEKAVGYMALSLMLRPGDELMTLAVNSMRNDIIGQLVHGQTLALAAVSNIGGTDLAEALASDVQNLLISTLEPKAYHNTAISAQEEAKNRSLVTKKSVLCLLRLFRTNPDSIILEHWMKRIAQLLEDRDLGIVTSTMSLLNGFAAYSAITFEPLIPYVISMLNRLVLTRQTCATDYLYCRTPSPWLQVKCLRYLQYYRPPSDPNQLQLLNEILDVILVKTDASESINKTNADHSILFEAINLIIFYASDASSSLKEQVCALLGRFIAVKDPNIRYLGLDAMTRLAKIDGPESVQMHQATVLDSLKDVDISVRKRALNLVYVLTDASNAQYIVSALLTHLPEADVAIKEDIVVKIAILAEKYSADLQWYVNTMIQVIHIAGDFVAEAAWHRVVRIIINNATVHEYAAI